MGRDTQSSGSDSEFGKGSQQKQVPMSRRQILRGVTGAGVFGVGTVTGADQTVAIPDNVTALNGGTVVADDSLLQENFEDYSVGSFPNSWSRSGNNDQQVVDSPTASGDQALEMIGSYGACWQALAHNEFVSEIPSDQTLVFSGHMRPTGTGGSGCHGNKNGNLILQDSSSTSMGRDHLRKLIQFRADGTVTGSGLDLGSCLVGEYNSFEVTYHWDSSADTVEVSYIINGESRGSTIVDATTDNSGVVVESELIYLTIVSGDYKLFIDDLRVQQNNNRMEPSLSLSMTGDRVEAGETAVVEYVLTNTGSTEATGLQGYLDPPSGEWAISDAGSFTSLGAGESETVVAELAVPESVSGEYVISGSVEDDSGNLASDSATITVEASGEPEFEITADVSPETVAPGEETTLEFTITNVGETVGSIYAFIRDEEDELATAYPDRGPFDIVARDDDGGTWDGGWLWNDIAPGETRMPAIDVAVAESAVPGEYTFAVENANGNANETATATVTVAEENSAPTAAFTYRPDEPVSSDTIEFDASSSSDPDGRIVRYEWTINTNGSFSESGPQFSIEASEIEGGGEVTLRVTDDDGSTDTTSERVTVRGTQLQEAARIKRSNAAEVDDASLYLSETQDVENLLAELRDDFEAGAFADESIPTETVQRHQFGELTTLTLLEKTGPTDTLGGEQIAVSTTSFAVNLGVSLVMMQLSFTDLVEKTRFGSELPNAEILLDDLDDAVGDLVSIAFSQARQSEAMSEIIRSAQEAYDQIVDEEFETADEFTEFLTDSIAGTVSNLTLQRTVETGGALTPFPDQLPLTLIDQFANAERSLDYLQNNLDSEAVQANGLEGSLEGSIDAHNAARSLIKDVASTTDTFLSELKNNLEFLSIAENVYELTTGIYDGDPLSLVRAPILVAILAAKAGLAVATVQAIGKLVGDVSLRMMMTINALGVVGVEQGEVIDLDDLEAMIPDPNNLLDDLDEVDNRWEGLV